MKRVAPQTMLAVAWLLAIPLWGARSGDSLGIVTINVWSGLDYRGTGSMGEYESPATRERRFQSLLSQLRTLKPDVIMLQEANPVSDYAARLADSLGFDELHQMCHAGIKFAGLGAPTNLDEGIAILAAPSLSLQFERAEKIGGVFGIHGSALSFHFDDAAVALEASIAWGGRRIHCINVHLLSVPSKHFHEQITADPEAAARLQERIELKQDQFDCLVDMIRQLPDKTPYVLGGDFNCSPDDSSLQECMRLLNLQTPVNFSDGHITWDARNNPHIAFTTAGVDARGDRRTGYDSLVARSDAIAQRLDYVFFSPTMPFARGSTEQVVCAEPVDGILASDHYGVAVTIPPDPDAPAGTDITTPTAEPSIEVFPILSYDTDVGFGYGGKGFLLNKLGWNESFDITLFNSTKGERWYRIVASIPDPETRQRTVYPFGLDVTIDYDKYITNSFFGVGNATSFENREYYTREPLEISVLFSRGFTESLVLQAGLRFQYVRNREIEPGGLLAGALFPLSQGIARSTSLVLAGRYDTRNSVVQPSYGWVVEGEVARAPLTSPGNVLLTRFHLLVQHYATLFLPATVLALRAKVQATDGEIPVQMMLPLGGNNTLRGFVQDRFLGKAMVVTNAELRFPIFWRIGGVAGLDAGNVWESLSVAGWANWKWNP
ncbi:MAG TPA: BamA/TamA family outer membrane protein, partial [Bacteroidota bacterium]|nr:BamA/TamA family outer membrane protein [Bacteroidota bacterium]